MLIIDFETRSRCNLLTAGSYKYASDPSTEIICMGWSLDGERGVWRVGEVMPWEVASYIKDTDGLVAAHNAGFDRLIWENLMPGIFQIPLSRWYCTAAQCRVNAMPASLGDATRALTGSNQKDFRGGQLIKLLSIPREDGTFNEDPVLMQEMADYCAQDIVATELILEHTRLMTQKEHHEYIVSEQINDDGVCVDTLLASLAIKYAKTETKILADKLVKLTHGVVTKHTQVARIRDWVVPKLDHDASILTEVTNKKGETKNSLDKNIRARLLIADEEGIIVLPQDARAVLQILDDGNKSSVAKFSRMLERAEADDRVRGAFVFAGASQTLRYASRGLQLHNFGRDCLNADQTELLIDQMIDDDPIDNVMQTLAKALRPAIVPEEGNVLVVGDWSSIEARALPWLSLSKGGKERLNIFREGGDIYQITADVLGLDDRQIGKVAELSLGYGGAAGAFKAMASNFGVALGANEIRNVVAGWRRTNSWAEHFWNALETAARSAISNPQQDFGAGLVSYRFIPELIGGTLICTLPNGTIIQYPKAKLETVDTAYGPKSTMTALKANWKPAAGEKEWPRVSLWRGLLAENITQAICAALLREKLTACIDEEDLPVIAHVHDEIIIEVHHTEAQQAVIDLQRVMEEVPSWAVGLPLDAKPTVMTRYGK